MGEGDTVTVALLELGTVVWQLRWFRGPHQVLLHLLPRVRRELARADRAIAAWGPSDLQSPVTHLPGRSDRARRVPPDHPARLRQLRRELGGLGVPSVRGPSHVRHLLAALLADLPAPEPVTLLTADPSLLALLDLRPDLQVTLRTLSRGEESHPDACHPNLTPLALALRGGTSVRNVPRTLQLVPDLRDRLLDPNGTGGYPQPEFPPGRFPVRALLRSWTDADREALRGGIREFTPDPGRGRPQTWLAVR